ncbi:hypothetical protein CspHIS471_0502450 [Cutaneotrichosporon sp. HIS471]|nr:hypothetical protein CspHIS471_0502450 [Cutaneotrichosporon sp. HIS471]
MNDHDTITNSELQPVLSNPVSSHSSTTTIAHPGSPSTASSSSSNEMSSTGGPTISVAEAQEEKKKIVYMYEKRLADADRLLARLIHKYESRLVGSASHAAEEKSYKQEFAKQVTKITHLKHNVQNLRSVSVTLLERAKNSRKDADEAHENLVVAYADKEKLEEIYAQTVKDLNSKKEELNVKTEELRALTSYLAVSGDANVLGYKLALATQRAEKYRQLNAELAVQKTRDDNLIAQFQIANQRLTNQILANQGITGEDSAVGPIRTARARSIAPSPFFRHRHPLAKSTSLPELPE